jgi:hypothetical protein
MRSAANAPALDEHRSRGFKRRRLPRGPGEASVPKPRATFSTKQHRW